MFERELKKITKAIDKNHSILLNGLKKLKEREGTENDS